MKILHKANWDYLEKTEIPHLIDKEFAGVTALPNWEIINELRRLGIATLELYENRTGSTVYRIRQTGEIYQIECINGETFVFDDAEEYAEAHPFDMLIESSALSEPKYTVRRVDGQLTITRTKPPRFTAKYHPDRLENIEVVQWIDPVRVERIPKLMTAAGTVIARFLKNEEYENRREKK